MSDTTSSLGTISSDLQSALSTDPGGFPFRSELSLLPLISFWSRGFGDERSAKGMLTTLIRQEIERAPELLRPIEDLSVIDRHRELIDVLMAAVFPRALWNQEYGAALIPFQLRSFYPTPACQRLLMTEDGRLHGRVNLDEARVNAVRRLLAYALILRQVYGVEVNLDYPLLLTIADPDTGLDRHFRMEFDWRFVEVEPIGAVPPLPEDVKPRLFAGLMHPEDLPEILPPQRFALRGFTIFRAIEVTDQEVLSSLKRDLIDKESIVSNERFQTLQTKLRTLFRRPDLRFGLAALEGDRVLVLNYGAHLEHACIFADSAHRKASEFAGSIYERAVLAGRPLIIDDLTVQVDRTSIEDQIIGSGVRNVIVAPLHYQDKVIGTLELGSPKPGDLDATHLPKLQEVLPLFAMAVQRSMEELNSRIQAFIKEQCTAIHPSVEWRFRNAVLSGIERMSKGEATALEMEPIVFENVYPLYGLSDIRGSSTQRTLAIQADLLAQLRSAGEVVHAAHRAKSLPALNELEYRIDRCIGHIERSLNSGDELGVISFLRSDVEPLFDHLLGFGPGVRVPVEAYRARLDPRLGTVYDQRRRFEESVTSVTETISAYLDQEERAAQEMFPHYFEKQKTDGVDYQIYVGASLREDGAFDPLYLKNLRLWQLMVTCGIALRTHQLKDRLALPLEATHLILVQHAPLAIRFQFDDKRFDVAGAYNIRYEIVKKRIDKAVVKGTSERVTQPDRIAVVYAQAAEAAEYRGYIEYLQSLGYLTRGIEDVQLEELQGVQGLRALRVTVELGNPLVERPIAAADLHAAAGEPPRN